MWKVGSSVGIFAGAGQGVALLRETEASWVTVAVAILRVNILRFGNVLVVKV